MIIKIEAVPKLVVEDGVDVYKRQVLSGRVTE